MLVGRVVQGRSTVSENKSETRADDAARAWTGDPRASSRSCLYPRVTDDDDGQQLLLRTQCDSHDHLQFHCTCGDIVMLIRLSWLSLYITSVYLVNLTKFYQICSSCYLISYLLSFFNFLGVGPKPKSDYMYVKNFQVTTVRLLLYWIYWSMNHVN